MDLRLERLQKQFGGRLAVDIPELVIRGGEFFTFVGPSGCGKSTTLNLIAGLELPSSGSLFIGERLLNDLPPHKRDLAFVFQSYALYPHRTVFRNLSFPLEMARAPREQTRKHVEEAAAMLGLTPLLEKYPRQLSGGERQRVALGRAIVRKPQLFLFDEPLSNLDAPLRAAMRKELKRLHRQLGTTFIYVTHDQEEALSLSDRIAVMHGGRIQQCAKPREIYDRPANRFVASFFGSPAMNFVPGETLQEGKATVVRFAGVALKLPTETESREVTVGIRPEHIRMLPPGQPGAGKAQVALVELHGGQMVVELDLNGTKLTVVDAADAAYENGQTVDFTIAPERVHLFDASLGTTLSPRPSSP